MRGWTMRSFVILVFVSLRLADCRCPVGGASAGPGVNLPSNPGVPAPPFVRETYILTEKGTVNCYGVVKAWMFVIPGGCPNDTDFSARFEVWRGPAAPYTLVGYNKYRQEDSADDGSGVCTMGIPANAQIPIEPDFIIGWSRDNGNTAHIAESSLTGLGQVDIQDCYTTLPGATCNPMTTRAVDHLLEVTVMEGAPPTLTNLPSSIDIYENEAFNTRLYTVWAAHPSDSAQAGGTLIVEPDAVQFSFTVDTTDITPVQTGTTGQLQLNLNIALDYETQTQHVVTVTVSALGHTDADVGTLTVNVLDINEPHVLTNLPSNAYVSVNDALLCQTLEIYTVQYTDVDAVDPLYPKSFSFASTNQPSADGESPFVIDPATGRVYCTPELLLWRDSNGLIHNMEVSVTDGVHDVRSTLTITIQDAHTAPAILNVPLGTNATVNEDTTPIVIFTVVATSSNFGDIRYRITDVAPREGYNFFSIDAITGDISVTPVATFDISITPSYDITVNVEDSLHTLDPAEEKVLQVVLRWVNRDPKYAPDVYFITIDEECSFDPICNNTTRAFAWPTGLVLGLTDRDADTTPPLGPVPVDTVTCGVIPSSSGSSIFDFQGGATPLDCKQLFVVERLDVDLQPQNRQINLTVRAQDAISPTHGDIAKIYITVEDINDNSPEFDTWNQPYDTSVNENTPGGTTVFHVTASDIDSGRNAEVRYYLEDSVAPSGTEYFQIDILTGVVTTKQAVNYEMYKEIRFRIYAEDRGMYRGAPYIQTSVKHNAVVRILPVNDIKPHWDTTFCNSRAAYYPYDRTANCFFNDELRADTLVGYHVMTILASDDDQPGPHVLSYHLLQPNSYFSLGEFDGKIDVNASLSTYVKYILYCYAQDDTHPNLITEPHLRVRIDTFDPKRQLIDIVLEISLTNFNTTVVLEGFLVELEKVLRPWFPKIDQFQLDRDKTTVSVYALKDNSTYDENNLHLPKYFVDRDELLKVLRKNFQGTPADILQGQPFDPYVPILVEPTYPVWILDTVPGLITLAFICLAAVGLIVGLIVGLCHRYEKCCFKKKPQVPNERRWEKQQEQYDRLNEEDDKDDQSIKPSPRERSGSTDTIHSMLFTYGRRI